MLSQSKDDKSNGETNKANGLRGTKIEVAKLDQPDKTIGITDQVIGQQLPGSRPRLSFRKSVDSPLYTEPITEADGNRYPDFSLHEYSRELRHSIDLTHNHADTPEATSSSQSSVATPQMYAGGPIFHHVSHALRGNDNPPVSRIRSTSYQSTTHGEGGAPYFCLSDRSVSPFSSFPPDPSKRGDASPSERIFSTKDYPPDDFVSQDSSDNQQSQVPRPGPDLTSDFIRLLKGTGISSLNGLASFSPFGNQPTEPQQGSHESFQENGTSTVRPGTSHWGIFGSDETLGASTSGHQKLFDSTASFSRGQLSRESSGLLPRELAEQLRKGVSFTANVAGGAFRMPELKGIPKAPRVPKAALDLSTAALRVLEAERLNRREIFENRWDTDARTVAPSLDGLLPEIGRGGRSRSFDLSKRLSAERSPSKSPVRRSDGNIIDQGYLKSSAETGSTDVVTDPGSVAKIGIAVSGPTQSSSLGSFEHLEHPIPPDVKESISEMKVWNNQTVEVASIDNQPPPVEHRVSTTLDKLVLMTFNTGLLEYRMGGVTWYSNPPFTKRRLYHIAPALKKANCDVVALQEVYEEWQADFLTESLRIIYPFIARRTSGGSFALHNGLMIMSRFPILHTSFHLFHSVTPLEKMFGSKGMLEATVEIPTIGRVTFLNIHLASGAVDPESEALEAVRNDEIHQALDVCTAASNRGEIPVIIGDLNAAPNLSPSNYRIFLEHGWRDSFLLAVKGEDAADPWRELTRLESWNSGSCRTDEDDCMSAKITQSMEKVRKVLGLSEESLKKLFFENDLLRRRGPEFPTDRLDKIRTKSTFLNSEKTSSRRRRGRLCGKRNKTPMVEIVDSRYHSSHADEVSSTGKMIDDDRRHNWYGESDDSAMKVQKLLSEGQESSGSQQNSSSGLADLDITKIRYETPITSAKESSDTTSPETPSPELVSEAEQERGQLLQFGHEPEVSQVKDPSTGETSKLTSLTSSICNFSNPSSSIIRVDEAPCMSSPRRHFTRLMKSSPPLPTSGEKRSRRSKLKRKKVERSSVVSAASEELERLTISQGRRGSLIEGARSLLTKGNRPNDDDAVLEIDTDQDPFCTDIFTWDPRNPLNGIGPHSECHGLRCDHIFLPPHNVSGGLVSFQAVDASVVFTEPSVTVEGCCCGLMGQGSLVTLSDHYAVRIEMRRSVNG